MIKTNKNMNINNKKIVKNAEEAFSTLKTIYPIPNYLSGKEGYFFIADLISRFLPNGGRILDLGCGGMPSNNKLE